MSKGKSGKKKVRPSKAAPAATRAVDPAKPLLAAEILPAGGVVRGGAAPRLERVEPEEKSFYGETGPQMLGRVRRELRNIVILAVVSFGVGMLVVQFIKI